MRCTDATPVAPKRWRQQQEEIKQEWMSCILKWNQVWWSESTKTKMQMFMCHEIAVHNTIVGTLVQLWEVVGPGTILKLTIEKVEKNISSTLREGIWQLLRVENPKLCLASPSRRCNRWGWRRKWLFSRLTFLQFAPIRKWATTSLWRGWSLDPAQLGVSEVNFWTMYVFKMKWAW